MKKIEIIKSKFKYLEGNGFTLTLKHDHPEYECLYTNNQNVKIKISYSEDYRDENRICLEVKINLITLLSIIDDAVVNESFIGLQDMILAIKEIYEEAENSHKGFAITHFTKIVDLYSKFVEINLSTILGKT